MGSRWRLAVAVGAVVGMVACGDADEQPEVGATPDPEPTPEAPAEPTEVAPSPGTASPDTGAEDVLVGVDVAAGIVVAGLPEVAGAEAAAVRAAITFEAARLEALMTNDIPDTFYRVAAPELHGWVEGHVADQVDNGYRLAGEFVLTYLSMDASESITMIDLCLDDRGSYVEADDGAEHEITNPDDYAVTATVSDVGSGWQVTSHDMEPGC